MIRALSSGDLIYIVEDFLSDYFNLDSVTLKREHITKLEELYKDYGIEVDWLKENKG